MAYQIGSQVEIQVRRPSHVIGRAFEEHTYTGIVVSTPHWLDRNYVSVHTGNIEYPVSHIYIPNIVGQNFQTQNLDLRLFKVTSKSKNKSYMVSVQGLKVQCDCVGFQFHRYCRHSTAVKKQLGI